MQLAALLLALAKAIPAAGRLLDQLVVLYGAWKAEENREAQHEKDRRNDARVDAARADALGVLDGELCPACPYRAAGQHRPPGPAPAVPPGGSGGA